MHVIGRNMTRCDLCATLPRPHLLVTPLTLSKPSYQEEMKDIATRGTSSHAQPLMAPPRYSSEQKCTLEAVRTTASFHQAVQNVNTPLHRVARRMRVLSHGFDKSKWWEKCSR